MGIHQHLRPHPYNVSHGVTTLRILGKLGGRNRRMMKEPRVLSFEVDRLAPLFSRRVLPWRNGGLIGPAPQS